MIIRHTVKTFPKGKRVSDPSTSCKYRCTNSVYVCHFPYLTIFMKFLLIRDDYRNNSMFSNDQSALITPEDVIRKLNMQAFGAEDPPLGRGNALQIRSSTAQAWKKSLS